MTGSLLSADARHEREAVDPDELVTANVDLVPRIVAEFIGRVPAHVGRADLESAGRLALVQAAGGFDPSRGVPFVAFAMLRIRGAVLDEMRGQDWAARSVRVKSRRIEEATDRLTALVGRRPTDRELSDELGIDASELRAVHHDVHRASLLSLQGFADPSTLDEMLPWTAESPEAELVHREELGYLQDAVAVLPERLRRVVESYYLDEQPMAVMAAELGVSESRVSQLRSDALELMRDGLLASLDSDRLAAPAKPGGCVARRRAAYFEAVASRRTFRGRLASPVV
jgi:RNA polymerase sigma factor for flagellar operon FliA